MSPSGLLQTAGCLIFRKTRGLGLASRLSVDGRFQTSKRDPVQFHNGQPHLMGALEPIETIRRRLQYQSCKRGMLENCILLSTFSDKYLQSFNKVQLEKYDKLINTPTDDWEIYYWATGKKPTPSEFNNDVMDLLKKHVKNVK